MLGYRTGVLLHLRCLSQCFDVHHVIRDTLNDLFSGTCFVCDATIVLWVKKYSFHHCDEITISKCYHPFSCLNGNLILPTDWVEKKRGLILFETKHTVEKLSISEGVRGHCKTNLGKKNILTLHIGMIFCKHVLASGEFQIGFLKHFVVINSKTAGHSV